MPSAIKADEVPSMNAGELYTFLSDDGIPNEMLVIFRNGNVDHLIGKVQTRGNFVILEAK